MQVHYGSCDGHANQPCTVTCCCIVKIVNQHRLRVLRTNLRKYTESTAARHLTWPCGYLGHYNAAAKMDPGILCEQCVIISMQWHLLHSTVVIGAKQGCLGGCSCPTDGWSSAYDHVLPLMTVVAHFNVPSKSSMSSKRPHC